MARSKQPLAARYLAVVIIAYFGTGVAVASVHRCYVCVPRSGTTVADVQGMFPGQVPLPKCDNFDPDEALFKKDCPAGFNGCITQTNGNHVTRTCGDLPVNDCKIANNIQYCYCSGPLCNALRRSPHPTTAATVGTPPPSDDEDLAHEGSGAGAVDVHHPTPATPRVTPMTTASPSVVRSDASRTYTASAVFGVLVLVWAVTAKRR